MPSESARSSTNQMPLVEVEVVPFSVVELLAVPSTAGEHADVLHPLGHASQDVSFQDHSEEAMRSPQANARENANGKMVSECAIEMLLQRKT